MASCSAFPMLGHSRIYVITAIHPCFRSPVYEQTGSLFAEVDLALAGFGLRILENGAPFYMGLPNFIALNSMNVLIGDLQVKQSRQPLD